ncbi:NAD(P)-dependent oxidoreductase [Kineosporia succinea]|uniref:NAD(P)-binding domain-containing protein n=1 Tax=Kineosporia succinea TaxID=84632 RepID=A0ABT9PBQ5_9ACTN|nr:NAD(P)H-binding protein [Kineosporia succinea]MDP9830139.1 hypothetical protein [Kineosporia succinea]
MRIAVLAATGRTGRHLTAQALARGHQVVALARTPADVPGPADWAASATSATSAASDASGTSGASAASDASDASAEGRLIRVAADVRDLASLTAALQDADVVVSGLGQTKNSPDDLLASAAGHLTDLMGPRVVWLGAFGTGPSAGAAGPLTRGILRVALGSEIPDRVRADARVLEAGGTVFHAGPLTDGPLGASRRVVPLSQAPRNLFPRTVSRATVAAGMLDVAERAGEGGVFLPLP